MSVCQSCGACCVSFRVDFRPVDVAGGAFAGGQGVPLAMTVPAPANIVRMCGTDAAEPRCVALVGDIGQSVNCSIYDGRPSPCREFDTEHAACNRARQRCGLAPL